MKTPIQKTNESTHSFIGEKIYSKGIFSNLNDIKRFFQNESVRKTLNENIRYTNICFNIMAVAFKFSVWTIRNTRGKQRLILAEYIVNVVTT